MRARTKDRLAVFATGLLACCVVGGCVSFPHLTKDTATFKVVSKERIVESRGEGVSSKYLVFTDGEVFKNTDCLVLWKFGSSDLQGELREGKTYRAEVYGWRIPFLSWYRNIVTASEVPG